MEKGNIRLNLLNCFIHLSLHFFSIVNFDQLHTCIVPSLYTCITHNIASYSLRLSIFVQWIVHAIYILKMQTKDSILDLMPKLKAVTSASSVVKILKTKILGYELHHVPSEWKTWNDKKA